MSDKITKTTEQKISELEARIKSKEDSIKKSQDSIRNERKILEQLKREQEFSEAMSLKKWFDENNFTREIVESAIRFFNWGSVARLNDGRTFYDAFVNQNQVQESETLN